MAYDLDCVFFSCRVVQRSGRMTLEGAEVLDMMSVTHACDCWAVIFLVKPDILRRLVRRRSQ